MRLQINKTKNSTSLYIVESTYNRHTGKRSNSVVKKLGTLKELSEKYPDPIAWGKELAQKMTEEKNAGTLPISVEYAPNLEKAFFQEHLLMYGHLFLQKIYYSLGLDQICMKISQDYNFSYDLNEILKTLIYGRILFPASKLSTLKQAEKLLEPPSFELHDLYRALEVLAKESDFIQSQLYLNSKEVMKRNDRILYYDCTNFYFEIEEEKGMRRYGKSKEHRPNPIVQLGLFMDADGVPLAFSIHPGNTNEQLTLKPLEEKIMGDFGKSKFVVCTDGGLSSISNRKFNDQFGRAFITTQSLKKMKAWQKEWALDPSGWRLPGSKREFNLDDLLDSDDLCEKYYNQCFYKERWFNENGLEQRYIVSFSLKYSTYTKKIREGQVERAIKMVDRKQLTRKGPNDPGRFIDQVYFDENGKLCEDSQIYVNPEKIQNEALYDGFYCTATNLSDDAEEIIKVNQRRWEIEESFRILKSEFKARPVFLSRDERIQAHFLICFLALHIFRILEKQLDCKYTCQEITRALKDMKVCDVPQKGFIPYYESCPVIDDLHKYAGFSTNFQIITLQNMKKIIRQSKNR